MSCDHCRHDNFRAFARLGHPGQGTNFYAQFHDGYIYLMGPLDVEMFKKRMMQAEQPGCFYNCTLRKHPDYQATRLTTWPDDLPYLVSWEIKPHL